MQHIKLNACISTPCDLMFYQRQVMPVELPGRNSRMKEPKPRCMRELVSKLADALVPFMGCAYLSLSVRARL